MTASEPSDEYTIIITSAFGLESLVRHELADLGYASTMLEPGRQQIVADAAAICRCNMFLRSAERVLLCMGRFPAADFDALFDGTRAIDWHRWIPQEGSFPVKAKSIKSALTSLPAVQRSVKKAVVDKMAASYSIANFPETGARYTIEAALWNDVLTLTMDTSGMGLHKRGYRPAAGQAPLRETLAAAMIQLAHWRPEFPCWDPFCGSGTIPIEAAMIARDMAPGAHRQFAAERWNRIPDIVWQEARTEAADRVKPSLELRLLGTDLDSRVLAKARANAIAAGVASNIHFECKPFDAISSSRRFGCIITNPPYGKRMHAESDEARQLAILYRSFPSVLRRFPTWSHYILTSFDSFEKMIGQRASKRRKLYNGRIECQFYQFFGPRPGRRHSAAEQPKSPNENGSDEQVQVAADADLCSISDRSVWHTAGRQAFGGLHESAQRQAVEFGNRLRKRARHLRRWPQKGIHCYRLYERDVPDVPLVVDRYENWLHIAEFDRPHERTPAENADWLGLMSETAADTLGVERDKVVMKQRRRQRHESQYQRVASTNEKLAVRERDLRFWVNLHDYLDTGLVLDHRDTRQMIRQQAEGKDVLNLFAYTGSFSVYAAAGQAASTRTVDLSGNYLQWAQQNYELNKLPTGKKHRFIQSDAMAYLANLHPDVKFDLVIVDPPTFSNSKELRHDWDIQRDYVRLLSALHARLRESGVVYFSTNFRRFKFDVASVPFQTVHEISRQTIPDDFRNRRVHRCWRLVRGA